MTLSTLTFCVNDPTHGLDKMGDPSTQDFFPLIWIAVIDDDASVRSGVSRLMRSQDFVCTTFESGEAALADPYIRDADCVILDIQLPGMNGFETRDWMEALGLRIPVIFITAHPDTGSPEWWILLKDSTCLSKPFEASDLIAAIHLALLLRNK